MKTKFIVLATLLLSNVALAQQKYSPVELNMDLPDETEETDLVEKGEVQFEFAYLHTSFAKGAQPSIGQGLFRYGLSGKLELRFLIEDGYARDRYLEETVQSTSPLALSVKFALLEDHKILPDITLVSYLKLPFTSKTSEQNPYWSPVLSLAFQNKFGEKWKFEYNPGAMQEPFGLTWSSFFNASLHYKVTNKTELFAEYYGQYSTSEDPQHNAGLGLSYQVNNILEFFAVTGTTVNYNPYNRFFSGGLAVRI